MVFGEYSTTVTGIGKRWFEGEGPVWKVALVDGVGWNWALVDGVGWKAGRSRSWAVVTLEGVRIDCSSSSLMSVSELF